MTTTKHTGSCQACGRVHALTAAKTMVHHGYERSGDGYLHGDCAGVGHPPYELSCELTKSWLVSVTERRAGFVAQHEELAADLVDVLQGHTQVKKYPREFRDNNVVQAAEAARAEGFHPVYHTRRGFTTTVNYYVKRFTFDVTRDHVPSKERGEVEGYDGRGAHDFAWYRQARLAKLTAWINEAAGDIEYLTKRVKNWVYAPEKLGTYQGSKTKTKLHWPGRPGRAVCQGVMSQTYCAMAATKAEVTCTRCRKIVSS